MFEYLSIKVVSDLVMVLCKFVYRIKNLVKLQGGEVSTQFDTNFISHFDQRSIDYF